MDCTSPKEKGRHGKRHTVCYILLHNHGYEVGGGWRWGRNYCCFSNTVWELNQIRQDHNSQDFHTAGWRFLFSLRMNLPGDWGERGGRKEGSQSYTWDISCILKLGDRDCLVRGAPGGRRSLPSPAWPSRSSCRLMVEKRLVLPAARLVTPSVPAPTLEPAWLPFT